MIYYVILTDNPFQQAETKDKKEAVNTCLRLGLPHFYEMDSNDPMTPKLVWKIKKTKDSYILESESWLDLANKHDNRL
jgi:hypothetical protein